MKNILKLVGIFSLLLVMSVVTTAFTSAKNADSDNYCTVTVYYNNGSLAKSVKVTTDVSGGLDCIGGRDFQTDSNGKVTLKWSKGCYLRKVYVKGSGYKVDYKNGNNYTLTIQ